MDTPTDRGCSVLVAHRDPVIRLGLTTSLRRSRWSDCTTSCEPAGGRYEELIRAARVVVVDHAQGLELCARRQEAGSRRLPAAVQILVVSTLAGEQEIRTAVFAGVQGYLLSGFELDEFLSGVETVSLGARYLCNHASHKLVNSMAREKLTLRERQVLRCMIQGYVNKKICDELGIALGTVKSHVKAIFSKFGVTTRTQAVAMATQLGLVSDSEPPGLATADEARVDEDASPSAPSPFDGRERRATERS